MTWCVYTYMYDISSAICTYVANGTACVWIALPSTLACSNSCMTFTKQQHMSVKNVVRPYYNLSLNMYIRIHIYIRVHCTLYMYMYVGMYENTIIQRYILS